MRIIVNHLTRMKPGYICVAGVDTQSGKHIRPVLSGRLTRELLVGLGGLFDIGTLVDLGSVHHMGAAPEIEDYRFFPSSANVITVLSATNYWNLLQRVAQIQLATIFGPELQPAGSTCSIRRGGGLASLGCLIPNGRVHLTVDYDKPRLRFSDGRLTTSASVTDLRLYEADQTTPKWQVIRDIEYRIQSGVQVILSVGLTRPWQKPGDTEERHWLQVNGVHLEDNPIWQVGKPEPTPTSDVDTWDVPF